MFFLCQDTERFNFSAGVEEGRDRCPYDPAKGYTGLLIGTVSPRGKKEGNLETQLPDWSHTVCVLCCTDGEMFTASQYEFRSSPDVRRNFPFPTLRTEEAPTRWLLGKCNTQSINEWTHEVVNVCV